MSLFIKYDFNSSSFLPPNIIKNISSNNNSNNGRIINNPKINSSGVTSQSKSIVFNSSRKQFLMIPEFNITNNGLSFSFCVKTGKNGTYARIFDFGNGINNNMNVFFYNNNLGFYVKNKKNRKKMFNVIPNIGNNKWNYITWVLSYPGGWKIYLNGSLYKTYSDGIYPDIVPRKNNYIGKSNFKNNPYFTGNIADFRIYNNALSSVEISKIYNDIQNPAPLPQAVPEPVPPAPQGTPSPQETLAPVPQGTPAPVPQGTPSPVPQEENNPKPVINNIINCDSLIEYDFSSYSFMVPDIIKNLSSSSYSYIYNAIMVNNPGVNSAGITAGSSSVLFNDSFQQYISIPSFSTTNSGLTFAFWFKSNNNKEWARIFDFGNVVNAGNDDIFVCINGGNLGFGVYDNYNNYYQKETVIPNINNNTWNHVVWTLTNPSGWSIYFNGALYTTFSDGIYPKPVYRNLNYIGKSNWSWDPYFNGNVADFRVYNCILSLDNIASMYNNAKTPQNVITGNAIINTGFNELYNQIFCDLFTTNSGFNQCKDCNYGKQQSVYNESTQVGEQNCLDACNKEPNCTAYSYDTTASTNNCKQYNTFPNQILNGVTGINSGYSLGKYTYVYDKLSDGQKTNVQNKCVAQYLNNYYTPTKQIDVTSCLNINTIGNDTNIKGDPTCIYNTYLNNGITSKVVNNSVYNSINSKYNLNYKSDPLIDDYAVNFITYTNNIKNVNDTNNSVNDESNINNISDESTFNILNTEEYFENKISNKYNNLFIILFAAFLILLIVKNIINRLLYSFITVFMVLLIIYYYYNRFTFSDIKNDFNEFISNFLQEVMPI
jgi:hypothetical protein